MTENKSKRAESGTGHCVAERGAMESEANLGFIGNPHIRAAPRSLTQVFLHKHSRHHCHGPRPPVCPTFRLLFFHIFLFFFGLSWQDCLQTPYSCGGVEKKTFTSASLGDGEKHSPDRTGVCARGSWGHEIPKIPPILARTRTLTHIHPCSYSSHELRLVQAIYDKTNTC